MTELSNAVTVLIARMESHPEDFKHIGLSRPKFAELADYLTMLATGVPKGQKDYELSIRQAYWFLTDADKKALVEAFKKMHYTDFEKGVMERVFDEQYYERQEEKERQRMQINAQMAAIGASTGTYAVSTGAGHIVPMANAAQNAAQSSGYQGLLGSAGTNSGFLSGIFK
jgi:hypothetical protein